MEYLMKEDTRIQVSGCDIDGISRGKQISLKKFSKSCQNGFGTTLT